MLKQGDSGPAVVTLQRVLEADGHDPGAFDGVFGTYTAAAVRSFQSAHHLAVDGVVGPATARALGLVLPLADVTGRVTAGTVSRMFPTTPVANIVRNLPFVLAALSRQAIGDRDMVLMALATIRAETASFEPIAEGVSHWNTSPGGRRFDLYDDRGDLGNKGYPDGSAFRGRGFVQLTGRANYATFGPLVGADLIARPELACDPAIAAALLAVFLKNKEARIREALAADDLATARRLVNGGAHGLADFTDAYRRGEAAIPV